LTSRYFIDNFDTRIKPPMDQFRDEMITSASEANRQDSRNPPRKLDFFTRSHSPDSMCGRAPSALTRAGSIISNAIVSNDCSYVGVFENSANAHTKYIQNNPVANALARGSETLANANGESVLKRIRQASLLHFVENLSQIAARL
jgi:hypothetical protein